MYIYMRMHPHSYYWGDFICVKSYSHSKENQKTLLLYWKDSLIATDKCLQQNDLRPTERVRKILHRAEPKRCKQENLNQGRDNSCLAAWLAKYCYLKGRTLSEIGRSNDLPARLRFAQAKYMPLMCKMKQLRKKSFWSSLLILMTSFPLCFCLHIAAIDSFTRKPETAAQLLELSICPSPYALILKKHLPRYADTCFIFALVVLSRTHVINTLQLVSQAYCFSYKMKWTALPVCGVVQMQYLEN